MGSGVRRAIGAILIIASAFFTGGTSLLLALGGTVLNISGQRSAAKAQQRKRRDEANRADAQTITVQGGTQPAVTGYGETIMGGVQVDYRTINNEANETYDFYQLIAHCHRKGGIQGITGYYLDDSYVAYPSSFELGSTSTARGYQHHGVPRGTWSPRNWGFRFSNKAGDGVLAIHWRDGAQTTAIPEFAARFAEYGDEDIGTDVCYSVLVGKLRGGDESNNTKSIINNGSVRVRPVIKLNLVYDPRKDSTRTMAKDGFVGSGTHRLTDMATWEWSDNPVLAVVDYIYSYSDLRVRTDPQPESYTTRIDARFHWLSIVTAANICDEMVDIPGGKKEKRYRCDVLLDLGYSTRHRENIAKILSSFAGKLVRIGGRFHVFAPQAVAADPALSFTQSDVAGDYQLISNLPISQRYNTIGGRIYDRDKNWNPTDVPARTSAQAIARDGVIELDLDGSAVTRSTQMQRLCQFGINQLSLQEQFDGLLNWKGLRVEPETPFTLNLPEFGAAKKFRAISTTIIHEDAPMGITGIEDEDDVYADMAASDYHIVTAAGDVTIAEAKPFAPTAFSAKGVSNGISWSWTEPTIYDEIVLYTSTTVNWSDAVEVWRGRATEFTEELAGGVTKYGWVRAIGENGKLSNRTPDDDISSVSATSSDAGGITIGAIPAGAPCPPANEGSVGDRWVTTSGKVFRKGDDPWGVTIPDDIGVDGVDGVLLLHTYTPPTGHGQYYYPSPPKPRLADGIVDMTPAYLHGIDIEPPAGMGDNALHIVANPEGDPDTARDLKSCLLYTSPSPRD